MSQLPYPALHMMEHDPMVQLGEPLTLLHGSSHLPQWLTLMLVLVSQLSSALPLQSPNPMLHKVSTQVPVAHDSVVLGKLQATPHVPQSLSVVRDFSQPSLTMLLQSA